MNTKIDWTLVPLSLGAGLILYVGSHLAVGNPPGSWMDFSGESANLPVRSLTLSTSKLPNDAKAGPVLLSQDSDGVIRALTDGSINLDTTEGKPFRLTGQVWLGGTSPTMRYPDALPDGFSFWLREVNGTHRYDLNSRRLDDKRRLNQGKLESSIVTISTLKNPARGQWIPFSIEATADHIAFQFGEQSGVIRGPLNMDGDNKIALAAGSQVRDLRLELMDHGPFERVNISNDTAVPAFAPPD